LERSRKSAYAVREVLGFAYSRVSPWRTSKFRYFGNTLPDDFRQAYYYKPVWGFWLVLAPLEAWLSRWRFVFFAPITQIFLRIAADYRGFLAREEICAHLQHREICVKKLRY
jgi:hypothetical protein